MLYAEVSTMGVPSKFSTPLRPAVCSPEFPERMAAGGNTDCPGNELDVVSGSADSAICDAVAFLVRLRRGKYPGIAEAVVPVMGNQGPVFWVELNCLRARDFALAEEEEGWWWWVCVLWEKEGKGPRER